MYSYVLGPCELEDRIEGQILIKLLKDTKVQLSIYNSEMSRCGCFDIMYFIESHMID